MLTSLFVSYGEIILFAHSCINQAYYKTKLQKVYHMPMCIMDHGINNQIESLSDLETMMNVSIEFSGNNNTLRLSKDTSLNDLKITINGNNSIIYIGTKSNISGSITTSGNGSVVKIGIKSTLTKIEISCENGKSIFIGAKCFFEENVSIHTYDGLSIIDTISKKRINMAKSVSIGNNVFIGSNCYISKGVKIADGCLVKPNSFLSKSFLESNCLISGKPSIIEMNNISWTAEIEHD